MIRRSRLSGAIAIAVVICWFVPSGPVAAQFAGGQVGGQAGGRQQGGQQGRQQGNVQGGAGGLAGGILIDPQGVVTPSFGTKRAPILTKKRLEAAAAKFLSVDVNVPSALRKISLPRLEAACEEYVKKQEPVPDEMLFLAGLQRIDYVFVYPETKDLVIAGPAEGFAFNGVDRVVGVKSGRPPLRLDDLMVALRALERGGDMGCSIDPDPKGLAALQKYVRANSNPVSPAVAERRFRQMARILGMQDVRVWGIPSNSHFAQSFVEADYRMKRISMALEPANVRGFRSHLSMLSPKGNTMQRWWFTPLYDTFQATEEGNAYQFNGQRAQLLSQEEVTNATGQRTDAAFTRVSTRNYAKLFTQKFPDLADALPIFAELQNLFDSVVLAAMFKKENLPEKADWKMSLFLDPQRAKFATGNVPKKVASAVNYRRVRGSMIMGLVGGGVTINPMQTVRKIEFQTDGDARLAGIRKLAIPEKQPEKHPWWWD